MGNCTVHMIVGVCLNFMVYCHLVATLSIIFTCYMEKKVNSFVAT